MNEFRRYRVALAFIASFIASFIVYFVPVGPYHSPFPLGLMILGELYFGYGQRGFPEDPAIFVLVALFQCTVGILAFWLFSDFRWLRALVSAGAFILIFAAVQFG